MVERDNNSHNMIVFVHRLFYSPSQMPICVGPLQQPIALKKHNYYYNNNDVTL